MTTTEKWRCYYANPDLRIRMLARIAVRSAVYKGRMQRLPCEVCGQKKSEAHHDDYSRRFDVRWLCREHHVLYHGGAR
jgi:hypothetical protein